jgi:DNA repair exonuclease SbcCD ATPase subunit
VVNKIDIHVTRGRDPVKISSGEMRKIDLCIQFALNAVACESGSSLNVLVCDEIETFLDDLGLQCLVSALEERAKSLSVFVTTQNTVMKSLIPKRWVVRKEGDYPGIARLIAQPEPVAA